MNKNYENLIAENNDGQIKLLKEVFAKNKEERLYSDRFSDEEITQMAGGEVKNGDIDIIQSKFIKDGLFDPDIFGGSGVIPYYDDENGKIPQKSFGCGIGYIKLPFHAVLESDMEIIAKLLNMNVTDINNIVLYNSYLCTDPGSTLFKKNDVITDKEYDKYVNEGLKALTGGDAIYEALKGLNLPEKPEKLAFTVVPVIAPITRPIAYSKAEDKFMAFPINEIYEMIIRRLDRCKRVSKLDVPEIMINNEYRLLNNSVNMLANTANEYIHCFNFTNTGFHTFLSAQFNLILHKGRAEFSRIEIKGKDKTEDIKSIYIYPEHILLKEGKNTKDILLKEVIDHNKNTIIRTNGESAEVIEKNDQDILTLAKKERSECTVIYDEKEDIYTLA